MDFVFLIAGIVFITIVNSTKRISTNKGFWLIEGGMAFFLFLQFLYGYMYRGEDGLDDVTFYFIVILAGVSLTISGTMLMLSRYKKLSKISKDNNILFSVLAGTGIYSVCAFIIAVPVGFLAKLVYMFILK